MELRAGAVDVMGGSCAESHDNQSRAVVINAHGNLDRLCWRGVFSSVDRLEAGQLLARAHPSRVGAWVGLRLVSARQTGGWAAGPGLG